MSKTIVSDLPVIETPNSNLWTFFYPRLQKFKNRIAVICEQTNKTYTYEDIINGSLRWSKKLIGLYEGSSPPTVAIITSNLAEFPMLIMGAIAAGTPICLIQPTYTNELIAFILKESETSVVVVEEHFLDKLASIQKMMERNIKKLFVTGENSEGAENFLHIISSGSVDASSSKMADPDDTAFIFYSSGTTGKPKGIIETQKSFLRSIFLHSHIHTYNTDRKDGDQQAIITTMTLSHAYGCQFLTLVPIILGCKIIMIDHSNFDEMIKAIRKYEIKFIFLRPFDVSVLAKFDDDHKFLSSLKALQIVGSVPNKTHLHDLHKRLPHIQIIDLYGLTEGNSITLTPENTDPLDIRMKLLPNIELQIRHTITKETLGPNQLGEIWIKSPGMMVGYFNNPEATREVIDKDGWLDTGDVGLYDEDHYITVIERANEIIVNSGKIVFSSNIEKILRQHPHVWDVGVVGIPRLIEGQVPRAYVVLRDKCDNSIAEKDLVTYANDRITCPEDKLDSVVFLQSLPRNPMGKILKKELRNFDWQENPTSKNYLGTGSGFVAQTGHGESKADLG